VAISQDFESSTCPTLGGVTVPSFSGGDFVSPESGNPANNVLRLVSSGYARVGDSSWTDYSIRLRVKMLDNTGSVVILGVRNNPATGEGYQVHYSVGSSLLWKQSGTGANFSQTLVESKPGSVKSNVWSQIELRVQGATVTALLDGTTTHQWTDPQSPYLTGGFTVGICCGAQSSQIEVDDLSMTPLVDPSLAAVGAVTDSASFRAGPVSAGEIIVVFGSNLGPSPLQQSMFSAGGLLPLSLGGTRILFDGVPAPLLYASATQTSAVVPYGVNGHASTSLVVERNGKPSPAVVLDVTAATPGVFAADASGTGNGAIINSDGTLNSATRPARPGDIVTLFLSGGGVTNPASVDGGLTSGVTTLLNPLTVKIAGIDAVVAYAGGAPQELAGLYQVNLVVPRNTASGSRIPVEVFGGNYVSQPGLTLVVGNN
jgi:uncharacterized protein (TIGR03437 family)